MLHSPYTSATISMKGLRFGRVMREGMRYIKCLTCTSPESRALHYLSPDRNENERIQDRQNAFQWGQKHIFRPHQHFTYDPSSWSRELEESVKPANPTLERLQHEAHQRTERSQSAGALETFSSAAVSSDLQQRMAELESITEYLNGQRHKRYVSVQHRERLQARQGELAGMLYDALEGRLRSSNPSREPLSFASVCCVWSALLDHIPAVAQYITRTRTARHAIQALLNMEEEEEKLQNSEAGFGEGAAYLGKCTPDGALREFYSCLNESVLEPSKNTVLWINESTPESLLELSRILTHSFTCKFKSDDPHKQGDSYVKEISPFVREILTRCMDGVEERATHSQNANGVGKDTLQQEELLSPYMLHVLARMLEWWGLSAGKEASSLEEVRSLEAQWRRVCRLVKRCTDDVVKVLRSSLPPPSAALVRRRAPPAAQPYRERRPAAEKRTKTCTVVPLDESAPSRGISKPLTRAEDISLVLKSVVCLMRMHQQLEALAAAKQTGVGEEALNSVFQLRTTHPLQSCLESVLVLLSFSPNYDIESELLVDYSIAMLERYLKWESPHITDRSGTVSSPVKVRARFLLILARKEFDEVSTNKLCQLCLSVIEGTNDLVHQTEDSSSSNAADESLCQESKRFRGIILQRLLSILRPVHFQHCFSHVSQLTLRDKREWEVRLNDGLVSVPVDFWREACKLRGLWESIFSEAMCDKIPPPSADVCAALLDLRSRCPAGCMDWPSVVCMARCLEKVCESEEPNGVSSLLESPEAWTQVIHALPEESLRRTLMEAQAMVAEHLEERRKVVVV